MEKCAIATIRREELSHLRRPGVVENHAIEHAVDYVAYGTGYYKCQADYEAGFDMGQIAYFPKSPYQSACQNEAKEGEEQLRTDLHTECHAVVFNEVEMEPRGYFKVLIEVK